jgi:hypothetical protein
LRERRPVDRERAVEENVEAGKIKEAGDEVWDGAAVHAFLPVPHRGSLAHIEAYGCNAASLVHTITTTACATVVHTTPTTAYAPVVHTTPTTVCAPVVHTTTTTAGDFVSVNTFVVAHVDVRWCQWAWTWAWCWDTEYEEHRERANKSKGEGEAAVVVSAGVVTIMKVAKNTISRGWRRQNTQNAVQRRWR